MSFKLLAIRPLDGCNPKFLKNLEENRIYKFYNEYEFIDNDDKEIIKFGKKNYIEVKQVKQINNPTVPVNLFGDKINISAIVGKNGSGKSSLVELLYVFFYQLSISERIIKLFDFSSIINDNIIDKQYISSLKLNKGFQENKIFKNESEYKDFKQNVNEAYEEYINNLRSSKNCHDNVEIIKHLKNWKYYFDNKLIYNIENLFVEVYYEISDSYYLLKIDDKSINKVLHFEFINEKWEKIEIEDKSIFYNLIVNYSLYGLNSNELGDWISRVLHKNDGYQTPIVINPYRENGIININSETKLSKDRLLSNILLTDNLLIIGEKKFYKLVFNTNEKYLLKSDNLSYVKSDLINNKLLLVFFDFFKNQKEIRKEKIPIDFKFDELGSLDYNSINYVFNKLKKVSNYYEIYFDFKNINDYEYSDENHLEIVRKFLDAIEKDDSHIAFKIKQTINFLILFKIENYEFIQKIKTENQVSINDYAKYIDEMHFKYNIKKEYLLPPAIFEIDYIFDNKSEFSQMSSGEKQSIYNINSIIYHLINLNSTFENNFERKYSNINLILDEIEQYAHPDLQKEFLKKLYESIKQFEFKNINSINIMLITHSPFILSDIPKQNILFLDNGKSKDYKRMNTFGANITDLLADSFFIEDGLIGDFAKVKIEETIKWINLEKHKKDSKAQQPFKPAEIEYNYHKKIINLIDEKVLRTKLAEMLDELKPEGKFEEELAKKEIEYLRNKFNF